MSVAYGFQYLVMGSLPKHLAYFRFLTVPFVALLALLTWFAVRRAPPLTSGTIEPIWIGSALVSVSWLLSCYFYSDMLAPLPWPIIAVAVPAIAFAALVKGGHRASNIVFLAAALAVFIYLVPRFPHDRAGDMLQIIEFASTDLLRGVSPFQPYLTSSKTEVPFGYWAGVWLPYVPFVALGIDARLLNLSLFVVIVLLFVRTAGGWSRSAIVGLTLLPFLLSSQVFQMVLFGHLWLYWLLVCVMLLLVVQQRYTAAALVLGLCLVSRPTVLFMVAPLAAYVWSRAGFGVALRSAAIALAVVLAVNVPFYMIYGNDFIANSFGRLVGFGQTLTHFSLAGILRAVGLNSLNPPLQALIAAACFAFVMFRRTLPASQFIMLCGLAYMWEVLLASYATRYIYFPGFFLVALGLVVASTERTATTDESARA